MLLLLSTHIKEVEMILIVMMQVNLSSILIFHEFFSIYLFFSYFFYLRLPFLHVQLHFSHIFIVFFLYLSSSIFQGRGRNAPKQQSKERMFDIENTSRTTAQPPETFKMVINKNTIYENTIFHLFVLIFLSKLSYFFFSSK